MPFPFLPFIAGAVAGGLATYLFAEKKSKQGGNAKATNVSEPSGTAAGIKVVDQNTVKSVGRKEADKNKHTPRPSKDRDSAPSESESD